MRIFEHYAYQFNKNNVTQTLKWYMSVKINCSVKVYMLYFVLILIFIVFRFNWRPYCYCFVYFSLLFLRSSVYNGSPYCYSFCFFYSLLLLIFLLSSFLKNAWTNFDEKLSDQIDDKVCKKRLCKISTAGTEILKISCIYLLLTIFLLKY